MTQGATLRGLLRQRDRSEPGSSWQSCAFWLERLRASADVVAVTPPGSYLTHRLRTAVDPAQLFLHAGGSGAGDLHHPSQAVPILLGEHARDRLPSFPRPWPALRERPPARTRPLDELYADSHAIGLLVLDCGDHAPAILRGAARVLADQAPLLLVDLAATPLAERPAVWEACVAATPGYAWHDGVMQPCPAPDQRRAAMLAPPNALVCGLPSGAAAAAQPFRVPPDAARQAGMTVAFDDFLPAADLYAAETNGSDIWRWTGPGVRSVFDMPLPGPGPWRLHLQVLNWGAVTVRDQLRLYADGVRLALEHTGPRRATFAPFAVSNPHAGAARMTLVVPDVHRAPTGDPRMLGICLTHCALEKL